MVPRLVLKLSKASKKRLNRQGLVPIKKMVIGANGKPHMQTYYVRADQMNKPGSPKPDSYDTTPSKDLKRQVIDVRDAAVQEIVQHAPEGIQASQINYWLQDVYGFAPEIYPMDVKRAGIMKKDIRDLVQKVYDTGALQYALEKEITYESARSILLNAEDIKNHIMGYGLDHIIKWAEDKDIDLENFSIKDWYAEGMEFDSEWSDPWDIIELAVEFDFDQTDAELEVERIIEERKLEGGKVYESDGSSSESESGGAKRRGEKLDQFTEGEAYREYQDWDTTLRQQLLEDSEEQERKHLGGGVNGTYWVALRDMSTEEREDWIECVWKPAEEEYENLRQGIPTGEGYLREAFVWEVAKEIGGFVKDMVPPTVVRTLGSNEDGQETWGSAQEFQGGLMFSFESDDSPPPNQAHAAALLDFILCNTDRHSKNYMMTQEGDIRLIDHGCVLPDVSNSRAEWYNSNFLEFIDPQPVSQEIFELFASADWLKLANWLRDNGFAEGAVQGFIDRVLWFRDHKVIPGRESLWDFYNRPWDNYESKSGSSL